MKAKKIAHTPQRQSILRQPFPGDPGKTHSIAVQKWNPWLSTPPRQDAI
jgi:hypothetical protein